ncbi:MAG: protease Lon-related BREX system protein BrxL [Clostridiales Family XIII bacterium]|jgi:ATP-dependent Lon protease|nr:protease Lon-related BREX system protein BrxL [Clostridiales Family XIII bacterium]
MDDLDRKAVGVFAGKVVRKDLTALLKRGANVPTYVLEYLLGMYCSTDDEAAIEEGVATVRRILTENYVRPDESEKIKSRIREKGEYTVIDRVSARLDEYKDFYVASFSNLDIDPFIMPAEYVRQYTKILMGGIWCITRISYTYENEDYEYDGRKSSRKKRGPEDSPFHIESLKPIQMPNLDVEEPVSKRAVFSFEEWRDLLLRSAGYEPEALSDKERMHFIERMVPLVERNYNYCELGPRGTGKSHIYKEISPYSILMSGGQTSTANLFLNLSTGQVGLVGHWDCVAFDEVAGMRFRSMDAIQIMKDYMASGSFARGKDVINADASMVFVGNINDSVETLLKTNHLFFPFPPEFSNDSAFFDRIHCYLPGWETPKMRTELLTGRYGLITDFLAEYCKEMRRFDFTHLFDAYFSLNGNFNQRDTISVRKTFSGLAKLLFPDKVLTKDETAYLLRYAIEGRRRVKEQLKLMAGVEFSDVALGFVDIETGEEEIVPVPEQISSTLIPPEKMPPGHVFAVGPSMASGEMCVYRLENRAAAGQGKMDTQGIAYNMPVRECIGAAFEYFMQHGRRIAPGTQLTDKNFYMFYRDSQAKGLSDEVALGEFIGLCSALIDRPVAEAIAVAGDIKLSGTVDEVSGVEDILRVAKNAGAKRVLLPLSCTKELANMPAELVTQVQPVFYADPVNAAKIALDL